ncbi:MAG: Hsp70 family protein [Deltaproteobacteria bacterium]|nr:Hsp70 family protein [Deltaproteobacteria bacterium]
MTHFLGIDLGTTNSVAALFDGETVTPVRSSGGYLVPSVVHLGRGGRVSVGEKAKRLAEKDPLNSRTGFKRLMGTEASFEFPIAEGSFSPVTLSAHLLRSLRDDVKTQTGILPEQAIITVPAIFDLPQCRATTEAAQAAGFCSVELVQEPVASALAAGWSQESHGYWMVFDLGGGTFDVTLLSEEERLSASRRTRWTQLSRRPRHRPGHLHLGPRAGPGLWIGRLRKCCI